MLQPFGRWEGRGGEASRIPCFRRCEAWFHRTRLRAKRAPEGRERQMARGVKSNFRTSRIVLVKYMSSVCALTEDLYKHLKFDKQHPILASIQCHSNTTISSAMLKPTLTVHINSNTTISAAILSPTLPARLLQYPNVNSLASSPGRKIFRSRSQRIWFLPQNVMSSSPPSWVWSTLKKKLHRQEHKKAGSPSEEQMSRGSCNISSARMKLSLE